MKSPDRVLVWLLRISGVVTLAALGAVFMPYKWMNAIHQWLGMGELPHMAIVGYLTRSLSALYALHGALLLFISRDVHRYLPLVWFVGWAGVLMGVILIGIDLAVGIPTLWTICEGPSVIALNLLILLLVQRVKVLSISSIAVLIATAAASPAGTIDFSGYTWVVRSAGRGGPGPNYWEPNNVWVDTNGWLHLRLTQRDGKWYCSELYTRERFGFGRYEFGLTGPVDRMDRKVVLGLFNYPTADVGRDGTHEIDIEFAQWGNSSAPSGNYTVWPATNAVRRESKAFAFTLKADSTRHSFTWTSTNVVFESQEEHGGNRTSQLANWVYQPTNPAACISQKPMPVHLNLWCFKGQPPSDGKEVELIVRAFKFTPL